MPGSGDKSPHQQFLVPSGDLPFADVASCVLAARFLAACALALGLATPVSAGPLDDASAAYQQGDYASALRLFRPLAEQGNARAQTLLGLMYEDGQGVPKNFAQAAKWYQRASEQDFAMAQNNLGLMYLNGEGVPKDPAQAAKWYFRAAKLGLAEAQTSLGYMYYFGQGVPKDFAQSAKWYRRAAEQGSAPAQFSLGFKYYHGEGVQKSVILAYVWFNLAAAQGDEKAANSRDSLAAEMTREQIAEAQKLSHEWKPTK